MVNEWLRRPEKRPREPFPERTVIELPRYGLNLWTYLARVGKFDLADPELLEKDLDRRSFVVSLFGGLAAASLGGIAIAQAASPKTEVAPAAPTDAEIDATTKASLDQAEAEFSQHRGHHRGPRHHPHHPHRPRHHRPPVHRHVYRRPRRVVRNGRVYYIR
jgi:hypothetical protein